MTTAARPTFEPARGGRGKGEGDLSALSKQYSSRDLPGHTKIKYRSADQSGMELWNFVALRCKVHCWLARQWGTFRKMLCKQNCSTTFFDSVTLKMALFCSQNIKVFSISGNLPRMPQRRCAPVTSVGSWRRGSAWLYVKKPERGDQEVGLSGICDLKLKCFLVYIVPYFILQKQLLKKLNSIHFLEHTTSSSSSSSSSSKRPRLDQIPAANLDADDPLTDVSISKARVSGRLVTVTHQISHQSCLVVFFVFLGGWGRRLWGGEWWRRHCSSSGRTGENQEGAGWRARTQSKVSFHSHDVWVRSADQDMG